MKRIRFVSHILLVKGSSSVQGEIMTDMSVIVSTIPFINVIMIMINYHHLR